MSRFIKLDQNLQPLPADATDHVAVLDTCQNLIFTVDNLCGKSVAHKKAEKLAAECRLAGVDGWRLPTVEELFLIADRSKKSPAIDTDVFPGTKSDWYWTSTDSAWSAECAWLVGFGYGGANDDDRDYGAFVRAVRSPGQ